ncbi:MmgE/PrpD family protein [Pyramidobacter piscolens]|uniref:MmgE/PrpD family protein n=1 Tax=Pyramidobacter piscolens TaxID=638849 RepID=UPI0026E02FA1|nr:MmgE/PrpD family protein [Pyramidobacter piscolens]
MEQLRKLAAFVGRFRLADAPAEVLAAAKACVLDSVSVALGARDNPLCSSVRSMVLEQYPAPAASATIWGTTRKVPIAKAAFLNGMAGHTLELDDVHAGSKTHIGTVVIPAAWAVAESLGKSGKELLEAVICGYETMSRIGMGFGVMSHRNLGWHVTSTAGTFGAAAACGKLFGFERDQLLSTFGLAGTQSFGTWAFLTGGATNKVLHPGRSSELGLESCLLAKAGMKGSAYILDAADGGLFAMMSDKFDYDLVCKGLGEIYEILNVDKKPYPCCRSAHGSIDAAIALRNEHAIKADEVAHVTVDTYLVGYKQIGLSEGSRKPSLPTEAKFSTPYVVACALLKGSVGLDDFIPENIVREDRQNFLARVEVRPSDEFSTRYPAHWGCRMTIAMKNGEQYVKTVPDASGSVLAPLTAEQIVSKAMNCCFSYHGDTVKKLVQNLLNLEQFEQLPTLPC